MYWLALEGFIRNLMGNTCTLLVSWIFLCKVLRTRQCDTENQNSFFSLRKIKITFYMPRRTNISLNKS